MSVANLPEEEHLPTPEETPAQENILETLKEQAEDLKEQAEEKLEELKEQAGNLWDKVTHIFDNDKKEENKD
jgi:F0F1-type ATP synthase membrane subunit b/b'